MKTVKWAITVEGSFPFPIDMLRYDECFPSSESESAKITRATNPTCAEDLGKMQVELATYQEPRWHGPNEPRWRSMAWNVIDWSRA